MQVHFYYKDNTGYGVVLKLGKMEVLSGLAKILAVNATKGKKSWSRSHVGEKLLSCIAK